MGLFLWGESIYLGPVPKSNKKEKGKEKNKREKRNKKPIVIHSGPQYKRHLWNHNSNDSGNKRKKKKHMRVHQIKTL